MWRKRRGGNSEERNNNGGSVVLNEVLINVDNAVIEGPLFALIF